MRGSIRRRLLALAVGIGGGLAALSPIGFYLEDVQGLDLLFAARGPLPAPAGVAVLSLHADGIAELAEAPALRPEPIRSCAARYPGLAQLSNQGSASGLPRELHACLIDVLTEAGAAAIAFDVVFQDDPSRSAGTRAIADAAARSGRVVLVRKVEDLTQSHRIRRLDPHLQDAGVPTASFVLDHDTARAIRFWTRHPALPPPHDVQLALRTLEVVAGQLDEDAPSPVLGPELGSDRTVTAATPAAGQNLVTAGPDGDADPAQLAARAAIAAADGPPDERLFNLYGPPGTIVSHSVADVLLGRLNPAGRRAAFAGRAVFVGLQELQQTSRVDTFDTAFSRDGIKLSGVELGATAYANLLEGSSLRRPPPLAQGLMVAGLGVALTASAAWAVPVAGIALSGVIAISWAVLCAFALAGQQLVLPIAVPLLVVLPLAMGGGLMVRYQRACDGVRAAVPRPAAERLLRLGLDGLEERPFEATVMMTDVAGWSRLADRHGHDHAHRLLNELFGLLTPIVGAERGLVLNFVADAMTAYWPAQGDPATAAERACRTALAIERALARANERFTMGGEPPLRLRIGINAGIVSAGATGAVDRTSFALVGETMNTTQRIERLGKLLADGEADTVILIADGVRRRLGPGFLTRDLGPHPVPGRDQPVHVHRLLAPSAPPSRRALLPVAAVLATLVAGTARAQETCPGGGAPAALIRSAVDGVTVAGRPLDRGLLPEAPICAGEAVAIPADGRAELRLASAQTELRLDGGTELVPIAAAGVATISGGAPAEGFAVRLLQGAIYLLSRTPRRLTVETPFVTAGIDGTEILLRVDPASRRTDLLVLEGAVAVTPDLVGRRLVTGQRLTLTGTTGAVTDLAPPGSAFGDPRAVTADALAWTLFYPDILVGAADSVIARAARLLASGRALEADSALDTAPPSADRDALRAIIALTRRDVAAARPLVASARRGDAGSATALLAESYLRQQELDLDAALSAADAAARAAPASGLARARLAELRLMRGEVRAARAAAAEAARLGSDPLVAIVQGYTSLAAYDTRTAESAFRTALRAESQNPLALLGLGLARIRRGDLEAGRAFLEAATVHDPTSALLRSYLGRAYFEERRDDVAGLQYDIAKQLNPEDPTPWYFDAIRKQLANRPVEALRDVERSIALNDNRAPFRSRLLLDQDQAARGVSLARIYSDLGFIESGRAEAAASLADDPTNPTAHRFLADLYQGEPRLEIARVSELLQAQLYGPFTPDLLQPSLAFTDLRVVRGTLFKLGVNEFSELFQQDGASALVSGQVGSNSTRTEEALVSAQLGGTTIGVGQFHLETDGFRQNSQIDTDIYNIFAQTQATEALSLQAEYRRRDSNFGDRRANFDPDDFNASEKNFVEEQILRVGARLDFSPQTNFVISGFKVDREAGRDQEILSEFTGKSESSFRPDDNGSQVEGILTTRLSRTVLRVGGGWGRTHGTTRSQRVAADGIVQFAGSEGRDRDTNYGFLESRAALTSTVQALIRFGYSNVDLGDRAASGIEPAAGLIWQPIRPLTFRLAASRTFRRPLLVAQSLVPTEVAGLNQVFDDVDGTRADSLSGTIEYRISHSTRAFASARRRWLVSELTESDEDDPSGLAQDDQSDSAKEDHLSLSLYAIFSDNLVGTMGAAWDRFARRERDTEEEPQRVATWSVPLGLSYFSPFGLYGSVSATLYDQSLVSRQTGSQESQTDSGALVDAEIGYRWPGRDVRASVVLANVFDRKLSFQDDSFRTATGLEPRFVPERTLLLSVSAAF